MNMDLYKHAFRLTPMISSDLVADCFELARDIRELDMRAAPYDLEGLGYSPVRIETAAGKAEYAEPQRVFAARGEPHCERDLSRSASGCSPGGRRFRGSGSCPCGSWRPVGCRQPTDRTELHLRKAGAGRQQSDKKEDDKQGRPDGQDHQGPEDRQVEVHDDSLGIWMSRGWWFRGSALARLTPQPPWTAYRAHAL